MNKLITTLMSAVALISTSALAQSTNISGMDNVVYLENSVVTAGNEVTVSVMLNNTETISAFEFNIELPKGISIPMDEDDYYMVNLSTKRTTTRKHILESSLKSDGSIYVLCYSNKSEVFSGNSGEVATITFKADASLAIGNYSIVLRDQVITKSNSQTIEPGKVTSTMTVLKDITLNDKGWATFSSSANLSVATSGVEVHTGTCDGTKVSTKKTGSNFIPANEGVLLKGNAGQKVSFTVATSGTALTQNDLLPTTTVGGLESIPNTGKVYVLNGNEFRVYVADTFVPNKAYLHLSGANSELRISCEDEPMGIDDICTDNSMETYNLQGQRLMQSQKGMNVINGEKVFVK